MKKHFLISLLAVTALNACSSIDSTQPFDAQQVEQLIRANSTSRPAQEMVSLKLPNQKDWKKIDLSKSHTGAPVMLIPLDESASSWKQSIRTKIVGYGVNPNITARSMLDNELAIAKANCKQADMDVIRDTHQYITYHLNKQHCANEADQQQTGKLFNGRDAVYQVYYAAVAAEVAPRERQANSRAVENATLIRDRRYR